MIEMLMGQFSTAAILLSSVSHRFSAAISDTNVPALTGEDFDGRAPPVDSPPKVSSFLNHIEVATASPSSTKLCGGTLSFFFIQHLMHLKPRVLEDR